MINPEEISIEYDLACALEKAYAHKATQLRALMQKLATEPKVEYRGAEPSAVPEEAPQRRRRGVSLVDSIQSVIGDSSGATGLEIHGALERLGLLPIGSKDPLGYVRQTLSKESTIFIRLPRVPGSKAKYTLSSTNSFKTQPTAIVAMVEAHDEEEAPPQPAPPPPPAPVPVVLSTTPEELAAAERVVDSVLEIHRRTFQPPQKLEDVVGL